MFPASVRTSVRRAAGVALTAALVTVGTLVVPAGPARADWCQPTQERPVPVVMLPGTWSDAKTFDTLRPRLDRAGYCTFMAQYGRDTSSTMGAPEGIYGTAPVLTSVKQVEGMLARVREITGARKLSLVTHSQGGLIARLVARNMGTDKFLDTVVTIASTANGTTALGAFETARDMNVNLSGALSPALVSVTGQAAFDQMVDSPLMKSLAREYNTVAGVRYLSIITPDDVVATPAREAGYFDKYGSAEDVWNINIRDCLPANTPPITHIAIRDLVETFHLTDWALRHGTGSPTC